MPPKRLVKKAPKIVKSVSKKAATATATATATTTTTPLPPSATKPPIFEKDSNGRRYWLIKSEPTSRIDAKTGKDAKFSISDLSKVKSEPWDGVRNYEAKNNLINMGKNDICLFYHSNCKEPGIVGLAKVVTELAKPDKQQFDSKSPYYDSKATADQPRWWCPDVTFLCLFKRKIKLSELKEDSSGTFNDFYLLKRGRLSVAPVSSEHFEKLLELQNTGSKQGTDQEEFDCDTNRLKFYDDKILEA